MMSRAVPSDNLGLAIPDGRFGEWVIAFIDAVRWNALDLESICIRYAYGQFRTRFVAIFLSYITETYDKWT